MASLIARLAAPLFFLTLLFAAPNAALAQDEASPLGNCSKSFLLDGTGPRNFDPTTGTGTISGRVTVLCDGTWVYAETITWDKQTLRASGDVLVIQEGLRVNADRVEVDRATKYGTFYNAFGTAILTNAEQHKPLFGAMEPEVMFQAEKIEKIGPRSYKLTNGMFSTCMQAKPRWELTGSSGTVILDDRLTMKNVALRVKGVPVLYLPYMYYPLKKENRATGFLIPSYSASGVRGQGISNAFFWAIDRSQDATFYHEWYSKSGQGGGAEYRYAASETSSGNINYYMMDENPRLAADGSVERAARRWFELKGNMSQRLPKRFWLRGNVRFFSDASAQQLYQQDIYEQSSRERRLTFEVNGDVRLRRFQNRNLRIAALVDQRDIFNGATIARNGSLPKVDLSLAGQGLRTSGPLQKVYFSAAGQVAYLDVRPNLSQPLFDRSLLRLDGTSTVSAPLSNLPYLTVNGSASWRITHWQESLDPVTQQPVNVPLTRNLIDLQANVTGPTIERVFLTPNNGYAEKFRHEVQPFARIGYLSPFNELNSVIKIEPHIDSLVGGTTSLYYGVNSSVWAKVRGPNNTTRDRPILAMRISQSWYSDARAGAIDPNYPVAAVNTYSPIEFRVSASPIDDVEGMFQVYIDSLTRRVQSYSARAFLRPKNGERFEIAGGWSNRPNFINPDFGSHFVDGAATVRLFQGRLEGMYGFNYDLKNTFMLQQRIRAFYGTQCCGFAVDYQMMNVSQFALQGVPRDRRIAVTFVLAGIGSFVTPLGGFAR